MLRRLFAFRRNLSLQLLASYLLFVGFVALGAALFRQTASQRLEADVRAADLALARAIAQETNSAMESALQAVRQLATYPAVQDSDSEGMYQAFSTLMSVRSDVNLVYRLDERGIMRFHYPVGPESTVGVDFSFRDYFQAAQLTRNPVASKGRISPTTMQPVATAVMPLWRGTEFDGVVATNMKLQSLSHALSAIVRDSAPDETYDIAIVDADGQIVANPDPTRLLLNLGQSQAAVVDAVLQGRSGAVIGRDESGGEMLYSYVPIVSVGWGVVVSRPTAVAFASVNAFQRGALVAIVVFLAGGLFFWLALARLVISPLERLTQFSQQVGREQVFGEGQRQRISDLERRRDQIGHLARSLSGMHASIEARLAELGTLLQTSGAVVSTLDASRILDRILEQVERLMGVEMCAIFALDEEQGRFRVQASRNMSAWYRQHAIIDPSDPGSVTMRAIRSGEPIQIDDTETNPSYVHHRARARTAGFRSVLAVPLSAPHASPAALLVFRPEPHAFNEREIALLSNFANHAAMAIENATLFARSDMRLQEQTRRLESLIQSMQDGLILEDLEGRVLYANRRIEELSGRPLADITGASMSELMSRILDRAEERQEAQAAVEQALRHDGDRRARFALHLNGNVRQIRLRVFDVTDSQGERLGSGRILQDITQRYEVDRMKSSLISTVSHELRTPLAAIKGYATTLLAEDVNWDAQSEREFLAIISQETDHLSELVDDLLDMSRIEAGDLRVSRQSCELGELVQRATQRARERVHEQPDERLVVSLPEALPSLFVDPARIETVLRNLIENAIKYSPATKPVRVTAELEGRDVVVRVADEGPGIPTEHGQRVFESFYRVDRGLARSQPGAGLGLAISQGFVKAHGGDIWLEAQEVGTCVAFSLPLGGDAGHGEGRPAGLVTAEGVSGSGPGHD
ncbi:MAG: ATP-binding protein [Candidatus Promineifilaceae bacterium]|nr:ATP-binding protein [Candidatus Promineifilaceae bacterium]